ncbi:MAG: hypothetical protein IPF57_18275 [Gammaproteobacteria bacterium]|nr:hypothetical protein [Gammaproteobacteria bacterium]
MMGLLSFGKGAKFRATKRFWWADRVLAVGEVVKVDDPALARELCGAGRLEPVDDRAREHLTKPAKWIEQPQDTTSITSRGAGIVSRAIEV